MIYARSNHNKFRSIQLYGSVNRYIGCSVTVADAAQLAAALRWLNA